LWKIDKPFDQISLADLRRDCKIVGTNIENSASRYDVRSAKKPSTAMVCVKFRAFKFRVELFITAPRANHLKLTG
jgi:hypothetical protein